MTCYFPNGMVSNTDKPCNSQAATSHCCRENDICLDNGFCLGAYASGPNVITRSTCTDEQFNSNACPQQCKDVHLSGAAVLQMYSFASPATYCCGPYSTSSETCNDYTNGSNRPFILSNGNFITNRTDGTITALNLTHPASAARTTTTMTLPANSSSLSAESGDEGTCHSTAVGAGVGVPLGVLLLLAIAALLFQRRRFQREEKQWAAREQGVLAELEKKEAKRPWGQFEHRSGSVHEIGTYDSKRMPELPNNASH